jgi:hypothetical protein
MCLQKSKAVAGRDSKVTRSPGGKRTGWISTGIVTLFIYLARKEESTLQN